MSDPVKRWVVEYRLSPQLRWVLKPGLAWSMRGEDAILYVSAEAATEAMKLLLGIHSGYLRDACHIAPVPVWVAPRD